VLRTHWGLAVKRHVKLRVGIAAAFFFVMVPLTLAMVAYLYQSNAKFIVESSAEIMRRSTDVVSRDVRGLIAPVAGLVQSTAEIVRADGSALQRVQGLGFFYRQLNAMPQLYSLYVGFEGNGNFYQVIKLPPTLKQLGPSPDPLPEDARYALRLLDSTSGARADSFIIYGDWGDVKKVYRGPPDYDPRARPWYKGALTTDDVALSDSYVFASSGLIGLTVSRRVTTSTGIDIGVVGADITLDTLSAFLENAQVGSSGLVFLIDKDRRLIGHPDPSVGVQSVDGKVTLLQATDVADPLVADAVSAWQANGSEYFEAPLGPEQKTYLVSFVPVDTEFGQDWTIGIAVDKEQLTAPLRAASYRILIAGAIVILIAIVAVYVLARMLTEPLQNVVAETQKIQAFDLDGDLRTKSVFAEVHQLTNAVATMKRSLRSFSAYVPKELVRSIVSDEGGGTGATRRQPLTVMFSDIKNFTNAAEHMVPELIVNMLTDYFERMSTAVHKTDGIVDKFIGDGVMAIWNAPVPDPDHIRHGCLALLMCRRIDREFDSDRYDVNLEPLSTRFSLHTGEAVVGNVGSTDRIQYSAFGSTVNLASRLESLNKVYGTQLLVSEHVEAQVREEFVFRHLDTVVAAGTTTPIRIFELLGHRDPQSEYAATPEDRAYSTKWDAAMQLYGVRDWQAAYPAFLALAVEHPSDAAAELMAERSARFQAAPPPDDWDGAEYYDTK
jgi:adenylate cyclase